VCRSVHACCVHASAPLSLELDAVFLVAVADDGTVAAGCAQDCPTPVLACPHDAQGVTCSGVPSTAQPSRHALHIPPQNSSSMRGGCPVTVSACM